jgi:hypothetical protein
MTFGAGAQTFTYYHFDRPDTAASAAAGIGMEVFDDAGNVVWTATQKSLRLIFGTPPTGRTYAHVWSGTTSQYWSNTTEDGVVFFSDWAIYQDMCVCTSTGVTQATVTIGSNTYPGANNEPRPLGAGLNGAGYPNAELFIVDVTNF